MALTIKEAQTKVDRWIDQFEEDYWPLLSMFTSLVEEVGELGREINNLEGWKRKRSHSRGWRHIIQSHLHYEPLQNRP
jgi:NTP pyrophosphatase (non-canonical NTP hydrolase)